MSVQQCIISEPLGETHTLIVPADVEEMLLPVAGRVVKKVPWPYFLVERLHCGSDPSYVSPREYGACSLSLALSEDIIAKTTIVITNGIADNN